MHAAKEKLSNMASSAKEKVNFCAAKTEEKVEKATARTKAEKEIAHERRKAKEAEAKREYHDAKADHKADRVTAGHSHLYGHHHQTPVVGAYGPPQQPVAGTNPVGTAAPATGVNGQTYYPLPHKNIPIDV